MTGCIATWCGRPSGTICTYSLCPGRGYGKGRYAQGIEARRAETRSGSVHESPVAEGHAPDPDRQSHPKETE